MFGRRRLYLLLCLVAALTLVPSVFVFAAPDNAQTVLAGNPGIAPVTEQAAPGDGRGFVASIEGTAYAAQPGKDRTTIALNADEIAGKTMHLQGDFVALDVDLDTLSISDFSVEGTVLYSSVVPQHGYALTDTLIIRFEGNQVRLERRGEPGKMQFSADDSNDGGLLQWTPDPKNPDRMNILYTLGPGIHYAGVLAGLTGEPQLVFNGLKEGMETTVATPNEPELAKLMSWTSTASLWNVSPLSEVESEVEGPFGTGAFVAYVDGVLYAPQPGKDRTTIALKAAKVAGKTMQLVGEYVTFSVNLDTFAITNYAVDRIILYKSVVPQRTTVLTDDLIIRFDAERVRLERRGPGGKMVFSADDTNYSGIMNWAPDPRRPDRMDIVYTLGTGINYTGVVVTPTGATRLLFGGMGKAGWETSVATPQEPELSKLVSWTATSSIWNVSPLSTVDTELQTP